MSDKTFFSIALVVILIAIVFIYKELSRNGS